MENGSCIFRAIEHRKRESVRQQTWLNSIIYYSSACGFDLASRPHSLTHSGSICFLKRWLSLCYVSSFIWYPSFSAYGETHPYIYICPCVPTHTYPHTHPLVKAISSFDQDGVQHLHFDLQRKKPSAFSLFGLFSLLFLRHLSISSVSCAGFFFFVISSSDSDAVPQFQGTLQA